MANFDKNKPAGSQKLRLSDDEIRANWDALEDAVSRNHKFPTTYGSDAGEHEVIDLRNQATDPSTPTEKLKVYAKTVSSKITPFYIDPDGIIRRIEAFPSGTKMLFYQDTAPAGWTIQAALNDKLVYVTKGSTTQVTTGVISATFTAADQKITRGAGSFITDGFKVMDIITTDATLNPGPFTAIEVDSSYIKVFSGVVDEGPVTKTVTGKGQTGGAVHSVGTWTISGVSQPSHVHTGPSHSHTGPSHTHGVPHAGWTLGATEMGDLLADNTGTQTGAIADKSSGAGGTGATGADGTGDTGSAQPAITFDGLWRPAAYSCIIAAKD